MNNRYILEKAIKYLNRLLLNRPLKNIKEITEVKELKERLNSMMYEVNKK